MSSYDSTRSGYPPHPQYPQQHPPYPTTPGGPPPPPQHQPTNYFSPIPEQQPIYPSSPTTPYNSGAMITMPQPHIPSHRRTSSSSSYNSQRPSHLQSSPPGTSIRQSNPQSYPYPYPAPQTLTSYPPPVTYNTHQAAPVYARSSSQHSHYSHHSTHAHDAHAYADGEDKYADGEDKYADEQYVHHDQHYGELDPETKREYERRYAKDKELERRPTLGGSLLSTMGKLGDWFGASRR